MKKGRRFPDAAHILDATKQSREYGVQILCQFLESFSSFLPVPFGLRPIEVRPELFLVAAGDFFRYVKREDPTPRSIPSGSACQGNIMNGIFPVQKCRILEPLGTAVSL